MPGFIGALISVTRPKGSLSGSVRGERREENAEPTAAHDAAKRCVAGTQGADLNRNRNRNRSFESA